MSTNSSGGVGRTRRRAGSHKSGHDAVLGSQALTAVDDHEGHSAIMIGSNHRENRHGYKITDGRLSTGPDRSAPAIYPGSNGGGVARIWLRRPQPGVLTQSASRSSLVGVPGAGAPAPRPRCGAVRLQTAAASWRSFRPGLRSAAGWRRQPGTCARSRCGSPGCEAASSGALAVSIRLDG